MNLAPWVIGWVVLAVIVMVLAIYRWKVANSEDDSLHVSEAETAVVSQQVAVGKRLAAVDRWGKILTVLAILYAIGLVGLYLYRGWTDSAGPSFT